MSADGADQNNGGTADHGPTAADDRAGGTDGTADTRDRDEARSGDRENAPQPAVPVEVPAGVLPNKAAEDDPRRWGDEPGGYNHDSWLREQKPPHWG